MIKSLWLGQVLLFYLVTFSRLWYLAVTDCVRSNARANSGCKINTILLLAAVLDILSFRKMKICFFIWVFSSESLFERSAAEP